MSVKHYPERRKAETQCFTDANCLRNSGWRRFVRKTNLVQCSFQVYFQNNSRIFPEKLFNISSKIVTNTLFQCKISEEQDMF